jgi:NAD(P)-dependent dehydrogenase (short-subunit alcohol dehydrogenase family)
VEDKMTNWLMKLFDLSGKTAIVTGASYGLGVTFAGALADQGANVVISARSMEKLERLRDDLARRGRQALAVKCDVANPLDVKELVRSTVQHFGRVDIMVNNAGIVPDAGMLPERIPYDIFELNVRVNLLGTWYGCREAAQVMLADGKGGCIINNASVAGLNGLGNFPSAYQAVKAAVVNLTRNLACSWADRGVRVNALAPGWFPSEMTAGAFSIPSFLEWARNMAPMRRIGRPEELAGALVFLASDAASFVTGQTLAVDGGVSATNSSPWPSETFEVLAAAGLGELARPITPAAEPTPQKADA